MTTILPDANPPKILVLEDEFMLAMFMSRSLRAAGYEIVGPVATVEDALATLRKTRPDACVLDIGLRGQISSPVATVLKEQNIPFLLATAYKAEIVAAEPVFEGVTNLGKPVNEEKLLAALSTMLQPG